MHGLKIRMCVFNHIHISIFTIRAGVFTRFNAYRVTSVNPPTCKKTHHLQYTVSLFLVSYAIAIKTLQLEQKKTKQKFILYRKVQILSNMKENIHVGYIKKKQF